MDLNRIIAQVHLSPNYRFSVRIASVVLELPRQNN